MCLNPIREMHSDAARNTTTAAKQSFFIMMTITIILIAYAFYFSYPFPVFFNSSFLSLSFSLSLKIERNKCSKRKESNIKIQRKKTKLWNIRHIGLYANKQQPDSDTKTEIEREKEAIY